MSLALAAAGCFAALMVGVALLRLDWPALNAEVSSKLDTLVTSAAQTYGYCNGDGWNCVVDGDTFRHEGIKIRIADIDTPEVHDFKCASEKVLGDRATNRLRALLSAGPFELQPIDRDEDVYGRKLRIVMRDGRSIGQQLVAEGLARNWTGSRRPWC